jgi:hypothetical protein
MVEEAVSDDKPVTLWRQVLWTLAMLAVVEAVLCGLYFCVARLDGAEPQKPDCQQAED